MALVTTKEMFEKAYNGGYAVGAFNVNNMEIVQGITEAAGELKSPVILQVSKGARAYANHTYLVKLVEAAVAENPEIPIALHLVHCAAVNLYAPWEVPIAIARESQPVFSTNSSTSSGRV